ncbi:unnamed protein product, partial [Oppiella nova]
MPNGNVGTPSAVFLELIRECRLPAPVISKLELDFPKSMKRRIYSRVEYEYSEHNKRYKTKATDKSVHKLSSTDNSVDNKDMDLLKTRNGFVINDNFSAKQKTKETSNESQLECKERTEEEDDGSDECEEEEWDRYESLHEDVTQQERNTERLFEEEIEVKWEKGGSGLVFYTDAQFWDIKDNYEDFNEKTPDDWDLDLSVYRKNCSADKEAIDLKALTHEMGLRRGKRKDRKYCVNSVFDQSKCGERIGAFERHTKGFGRRIMESQGWECGKGLGESVTGIPEPIADCGQQPTDKRGVPLDVIMDSNDNDFHDLKTQYKRLCDELAFERQLNHILDTFKSYSLVLINRCKCETNRQIVDQLNHFSDQYASLKSRQSEQQNGVLLSDPEIGDRSGDTSVDIMYPKVEIQESTDPSVTHTCSECEQQFASELDLQIHMNSVHKEDLQLYTCDECREVFTSDDLFATHMRDNHGFSDTNTGHSDDMHTSDDNKMFL